MRVWRLSYWPSHSQRSLAIGCAVGVAGEVYSTVFEASRSQERSMSGLRAI